MKKNEIEITFEDKSVPSLAGYEYGESVYLNQVKDKIDFEADEIILFFPEDKHLIASSFIEGFFNGIKSNIGITEMRNKIKIISKYENFVRKIYESMD